MKTVSNLPLDWNSNPDYYDIKYKNMKRDKDEKNEKNYRFEVYIINKSILHIMLRVIVNLVFSKIVLPLFLELIIKNKNKKMN